MATQWLVTGGLTVLSVQGARNARALASEPIEIIEQNGVKVARVLGESTPGAPSRPASHANGPNVNSTAESARDIEHGRGEAGEATGIGKPRMTAEAHALDGLGHFTLEFTRDLSPTARGLVRKLENQGWVRVDEIAKDDLVQISKWFNKEVAVVQSPYGRLRVILGTETGILKESIKEGEIFVVHTHPVMRSSPGHFGKDLQKAGKHVEAVVDWSGQVTYYSKSGIMNPRGADGILEPLIGTKQVSSIAMGM